jgi:hypothetical protein
LKLTVRFATGSGQSLFVGSLCLSTYTMPILEAHQAEQSDSLSADYPDFDSSGWFGWGFRCDRRHSKAHIQIVNTLINPGVNPSRSDPNL